MSHSPADDPDPTPADDEPISAPTLQLGDEVAPPPGGAGWMLIGRTLKGRYKLYENVGEGAFATVYLARDQRQNRVVAVKVLHPRYSFNDDILQRFKNREAPLAQRLLHPNIVRVFDFGEEDDLHFLVMEYVQGQTLAEVIKERGQLSIAETALIGVRVLEALEVFHQAGVVNRDIKPHNIMITPEGQLKVMDLGLAKQEGMESLTRSDGSMGTPLYMAPELFMGVAADTRSDMYALGVTLYQCLAGRVPFSGKSPYEVMSQHAHAPVPPLRLVRDDIPSDLDLILERALAKQPIDRFQTPREMLEALRPLADLPERPPLVTSAPSPEQPSLVTPPPPPAAVSPPPPQPAPPPSEGIAWKMAAGLSFAPGRLGCSAEIVRAAAAVLVVFGIALALSGRLGSLPTGSPTVAGAPPLAAPTAARVATGVVAAAPTLSVIAGVPTSPVTVASPTPPIIAAAPTPTIAAGIGTATVEVLATRVATRNTTPQPNRTPGPIGPGRAVRSIVLGTTVLDNELRGTQIGDGPRHVLVTGALHGGHEENALTVLREIERFFRANPDQVPNDVTLTIVPLLNPDDLTVRSGLNANGVDLDRNFGSSNWSYDTYGQRGGRCGADGVCPGGGGAGPFSEAETRAVQRYVQDNDVVGVLIIGSCCAITITRNGGGRGESLAIEFADLFGYEYVRLFDGYPLTGKMVDWVEEQGAIGVEISLRDGSTPFGNAISAARRFLAQT